MTYADILFRHWTKQSRRLHEDIGSKCIYTSFSTHFAVAVTRI